MRSTGVRAARCFLGLFLSLQLSLGPVYAYDYGRDRNRWTMPASRGNLEPARINWTEVEGDNNIHVIRDMQNMFGILLRQESTKKPVGGATPAKAAPKAGPVQQSAAPKTTSSKKTIQEQSLSSLVQAGLDNGPDHRLDRNDMFTIFRQVGADGVVSAAEFSGLQTILANPTLYPEVDYVRALSNKVVNGNAWNATYQGAALGNLAAGSSGAKLDALVNKWFLGKDHPDAVDGYGRKYDYRLASGDLFVDGATYDDIRQGYIGDCWLMASFAETALRDTNIIKNMFIDNGDGTYTVQFFHNGAADYVTVDKQLPVNMSGRFGFADVGDSAANTKNELWTALAEKAYIQEQAGWGAKNAYSSINGNYISVGLSNVTGHKSTLGNALNFSAAVKAWTSRAFMGFASKSRGTSDGVVSGHAYAVVDFNSVTKQFTLFNPWGINNGFAPALLTLGWNLIQSNFSYFDTAVA